jgi:hypothetical protein
LGVSSSQTLTDATSTTAAATASAITNNSCTANFTVDVAQPTVNFTLSKAAQRLLWNIRCIEMLLNADNGRF